MPSYSEQNKKLDKHRIISNKITRFSIEDF